MAEQKSVQASCQCEATTFTIKHAKDYKPAIMICHCTHCQKLSGGFGTYNISFPYDALTWTGQAPGKYDQAGDSGTSNTKVFCSSCGSTLVTMAHKRQLAIVKVPALGEHAKEYDITPGWEQFVPSKFACEPEKYAPNATQYEGMKK